MSLFTLRAAAGLLGIKKAGPESIFTQLRKKGVLDINNIVGQRYQRQGYFKVQHHNFERNRFSGTTSKTLVTDVGIEFIRKLLCEPDKVAETVHSGNSQVKDGTGTARSAGESARTSTGVG